MSATADDLNKLSKTTLGKALGQFGQQRNDLLVAIGKAPIARCRTSHANDRTGPALAPAMLLDEPGKERAFVRRVYSFFAIRSFNAWFSIANSAYIRLSLACSASTSRSRCTSEASMPPYLDFQT